jgi:hypothetical protein
MFTVVLLSGSIADVNGRARFLAPMNAQLSLYDALVSVNIPADKARAVVAALEQEMTSVLATKTDIELLRQELQSQFGSLRQELHSVRDSLQQDILQIQQRLTIRLGVMTAVYTALLFACLKLT